MAHRHIIENDERIARQQALIAALLGSSQLRLLPIARKALGTMIELQEIAKQRLQRIEEADRLAQPE
jgi:hypothetical protein